MQTTSYAFKTSTSLSFEAAVTRVTDALKQEGFGILTEIDVKDTLKKKIDVDFRNYRILGACSPPNAYKALSAETDIGLMLPCNVVVYEGDDAKTVIAAVDPVASMAAVKNTGLEATANEVRSKLQRVIGVVEATR
jgi:uncharacterized protein (DUF302 family)